MRYASQTAAQVKIRKTPKGQLVASNGALHKIVIHKNGANLAGAQCKQYTENQVCESVDLNSTGQIPKQYS